MNGLSAILLMLVVASQCNVHWQLWQAKQRVEKYQDEQIRLKHEEEHREKVQLEEFMGVPEHQQSQYRTYPEYYIYQKMDNFDSSNRNYYRQRYWVNSDYCRNRRTCPVFLYIGGEGACSSWRVTGGHHVDMARKHGAMIFAVEHRFYGKSINRNGLNLNQLRYLTSKQALADLAHFHKRMTSKYSFTRKNKWISFGGSYPGMLSSWFRIKYPSLVYGAIASSPPVKAVVDFHGYHDTISKDLGDRIVGGSYRCKDAVRKAFKSIDNMIRSRKHVEAGKLFKSCRPIINSKLDIDNFASTLAGIFDGIIQYNNEMGSYALNVRKICRKMLATRDPLKNFVNLNNVGSWAILSSSRYSCKSYGYQGLIDYISRTRANSNQGLRQWVYQTCNEFGFFQGCNQRTGCVFSKYNTIKPMIHLCKKVYGISERSIYNSVSATNRYYGGDRPRGSRIVYVNGSIDPWHSTSILRSISYSVKAVYIMGTSHCHDMMSSRSTDSSYLRSGRQKIEREVDLWLR